MVVRIFDIAVALVVLIFAVPVFLLVAILIKVTSVGPVFYLDRRVGLQGEEFLMYKFRSMKQNTQDHKNWFTSENDSRITAVGKFLRKSSLDELPQLVNVINGDMSLVGPRPESPRSKESYTDDYWIEVHKIRPGITGLAQINGRSSLTLDDKVKFDLEYASKILAANNMDQLYINLLILLKTFKVFFPNKDSN